MHPTITDEGNGEIQFHEKILPLPPTHSPALAALLYIYHKMHAC